AVPTRLSEIIKKERASTQPIGIFLMINPHLAGSGLVGNAGGGTGLRRARMSGSTAGMAAAGSNEGSTARRQKMPSQTMMKALVTMAMSSAGAMRPSACILRNNVSKLSAL